jgi:protein SCO1
MIYSIRQLLFTGLAAVAATGSVAPAQFAPAPVGTLNRDALPYEEGEMGVDEKPGALVAPDLQFFDEQANRVTLGSYLNQGRPIILWLGYYDCPMLCDKMSAGMVESVKQVKLDAGKDFAILNVSIDPNESATLAAAKKQTYLDELGQPDNAAAWHLLTGSPESIKQLTDSVGYKFKKVSIKDGSEYVHPAVLIILSESGKVTRYVYPDGNRAGVTFDPRTMQLSLIEAGEGKVGSTLDKVMLTCLMGWDGTAGKYTASVLKLMSWTAGLTLLVMSVLIVPAWIRAARGKENKGSPPASGDVLTV